MAEFPHLVQIGKVRTNGDSDDAVLGAVMRLAIAKLGFLLPIYVDRDYRVVSGYRRFRSAKDLGLVEVPVVVLDDPGLAGTISVATDEAVRASGRDVTEELLSALVAVPDRARDRLFPCLEPEPRPVRELARGISLPYDHARIEACRLLLHRNVHVPIVVGSSGRIVNGSYRVVAAFEEGIEELPCVLLSANEEALGKLAFDLFAIRSSLLQRMKTTERLIRITEQNGNELTPGLKLLVPSGPRFWPSFRAVYGDTILDIGCGRSGNRRILAEHGISWTGWDPFPLTGGTVDTEVERQMTDSFLTEVRSGTVWDTVLVDRVLDMIPYAEDRRSVLLLAHACCSPASLLVGTASKASSLVQQLHGMFGKVEILGRNGFVARWPRRVDWTLLEPAIRHEFGLTDGICGDRRSVIERALDAFQHRLYGHSP